MTNPANWKAHPSGQRATISELLDRVGWAGAVLVNERTGRMLDGHARREIALAGNQAVPVLIGDWSEEQERLILAGLDPSGWTAIADRRKYEALLSGVPEIKGDEFKELLAAVKDSSQLLNESGEPEEADGAKRTGDDSDEITIALDSIWPTDNAYSVPSLLPELQADQVAGPVTTWGTQGARRPMRGTWHFYTADSKFDPLWRRPHRVLYSRPAAVCECNFSTIEQSPFAFSLWNIYKKRWLARYWQAAGLRVFVDLNVDADLNAPSAAVGGARPNLLGVPAGWAAYSSRAHADRPENLLPEWETAREHSGKEHPLFLVVGGGRRVKQLAQEHGWVWVPEQIQQAHGEPKDGDD
jgi:hypothetical protein